MGTFRKDLYFRLNVVTIQIPALRERRSDIPALVQAFLSRYAPDEKLQLTPAVMSCLLQYDWPGNVRELENCIERAIALGNHKMIDVADLPPVIASNAPAASTSGAAPASNLSNLEDIERETIRRVFEQSNGDKVLTGKILGISRATLYRKLKRYNIEHGPSQVSAVGMGMTQ
jgi:transcriptional regulator with PAS, ATPase and Fis domain